MGGGCRRLACRDMCTVQERRRRRKSLVASPPMFIIPGPHFYTQSIMHAGNDLLQLRLSSTGT